MKITPERYGEIKLKTEDLTINELVKEFKISATTARRIRNTKDYGAYSALNRLYRNNHEYKQKYEKMIAGCDLRQANFNVALVGIIIIAIAVFVGIFL